MIMKYTTGEWGKKRLSNSRIMSRKREKIQDYVFIFGLFLETHAHD